MIVVSLISTPVTLYRYYFLSHIPHFIAREHDFVYFAYSSIASCVVGWRRINFYTTMLSALTLIVFLMTFCLMVFVILSAGFSSKRNKPILDISFSKCHFLAASTFVARRFSDGHVLSEIVSKRT